MTVRQYLAGLEIQLGGLRARTVKDTHKDETANRLYLAFRDFIRDPRQVQTVAADLKLPPLPRGQTSSTADLERSTDVVELQVSDASYVHRDEIEREFKTLVDQGVKLIALVGFPGMGKTSLAEALTRGSPFIEFYDGKPSTAHIQKALERYLPSREILVTPDNAEAALSILLSAESELRLVALDNLQSTSELRMISRDTAVTVVATCREAAPDTPSWCQEIRIGAMEEGEAAKLAETKHGSLSREDAQFVGNSLGRYPLLISLACRLASTAGMNIHTLCRDLQIDPGGAQLRADETLRYVATRAISFLRATDHVAVDLLTCVSYAGPLTLEHLHRLIESRYGEELADIRSAKSVSLLRDLVLIEPDPVRFVTGRISNEQSAIGDMFSRYITPSAARFPGVILDVNERVIILGIHPHVNTLLKNLLKADAYRILDHLSTKLLEMLPGRDITLERPGQPVTLFDAIFDIYLGFQGVPNEAALEFAQKYTDALNTSREVLIARLDGCKFEYHANPAIEQTAQDEAVPQYFVKMLRRIAVDGDENDRRYLHAFLEELGR